MNYRHAFHAGNFADVMKHVVVTRLVEYLKRKDKAFRVIDTHAGTGLYDLSGDESRRTGEWLNGIGRILDTQLPAPAAGLLAPYLDAVQAAGDGREIGYYPGSPWLVRRLLRRQDRLTAIEKHPGEAARLTDLFVGDHQVRVIELDGWLALGAHLPPKEKRGLVLVDPPFEEAGEFDRMADGLRKALRRWPGGVYAFWYPIKDRPAVAAFREAIRRAGVPRLIDIRLLVRAPTAAPRLDGCAMVVVNPPHTLEDELRILMPVLTDALADGPGATWSVESLGTEPVGA